MRRTSVVRGLALLCLIPLLAACGGDEGSPVATGVGREAGEASADDPQRSIDMPDLVGLTETEAVQELRALDIDDVTVETQESLEPAGTVLKHVPSASSRVVGGVTIVVATALPPNPDWVGTNLAEARAWYELRGVAVIEEDELTDSAASGTVVRTTPAAGEPVGTEVIVTVARRSFVQSLTEFEWVKGCDSNVGDADVNGQTYPRSIIMRGGSRWDDLHGSAGCSIDVNLSRDWHTLRATIGLRDDANAESVVRFEVLADGVSIYRQNVGFGQTRELNLDVRDVLRLRIISTSETSDVYPDHAVWGEPVVVGPPPVESAAEGDN